MKIMKNGKLRIVFTLTIISSTFIFSPIAHATRQHKRHRAAARNILAPQPAVPMDASPIANSIKIKELPDMLTKTCCACCCSSCACCCSMCANCCHICACCGDSCSRYCRDYENSCDSYAWNYKRGYSQEWADHINMCCAKCSDGCDRKKFYDAMSCGCAGLSLLNILHAVGFYSNFSSTISTTALIARMSLSFAMACCTVGCAQHQITDMDGSDGRKLSDF